MAASRVEADVDVCSGGDVETLGQQLQRDVGSLIVTMDDLSV